jgi:hypothetical protein
MCVLLVGDSSTDFVKLNCVEVDFAAIVSPVNVPANADQVISLTDKGDVLRDGDLVEFFASGQTCSGSTPFNVSAPADASYTNVVNFTTGSTHKFDFSTLNTTSMAIASPCVKRGTDVFKISASVNIDAAVVGLAGDPHVRTASGDWVDFYGETGVYTLLDGDDLQANAKFGYAIRDNFMIWHPKVMRPGTLVEEVGIQLKGAKTSLRVGTQGGGIVSVRENMKPTAFWSGSADRSLQVGEYSIEWSKCTKDCDVVMPWGTHQRTHSLTVKGRGELLQMFVAKSGGYRFVDIEAMAGSTSQGLLADASAAPAALAERLLSGGEMAYQVSVGMLS